MKFGHVLWTAPPAAAVVAVVAVVAAACGGGSPAQPSGTTGLTASITAPQPLQPSNSSQIPTAGQPVTLTVQNVITTRAGAVTYTFEVATDTTFSSKVQTKDGVVEGSGGQTSVKLDPLSPGRDYYWHAKATGGGTSGMFGPTYRFAIGAAVTLSAPVAVAPLNGAQTGPRPVVRVHNAARQGPAGPLTYRFEVAKDGAFTSIAASATVAEGATDTSFVPSSDLPIGVLLYWRATAIDAVNGVSSSPSAVQSFTTNPPSQAESVAEQLGVPLWPGVQPPGAVGHATMGGNWQVQTLHHLPTDTFFLSPTPEMLRLFDLLDRGFDPDGAISWMNANGYPTAAQWYPPPEKAVIGLQYVYLAARDKVVVNGIWDLVLKFE
jgi:hypothetical protein